MLLLRVSLVCTYFMYNVNLRAHTHTHTFAYRSRSHLDQRAKQYALVVSFVAVVIVIVHCVLRVLKHLHEPH